MANPARSRVAATASLARIFPIVRYLSCLVAGWLTSKCRKNLNSVQIQDRFTAVRLLKFLDFDENSAENSLSLVDLAVRNSSVAERSCDPAGVERAGKRWPFQLRYLRNSGKRLIILRI